MELPGKVDKVVQGSSHLFDRLKDYYFGKKETPPLISERTALLCGLLFTAFFVAPFYLSKTLRATSLNSRDAPAVIKARVHAVGLSCAASTVVAVYLLVTCGHATPLGVLRLLGVWPVDFIDCLKTLALVTVLFVGPLYETIIVDGGWREWGFAAVKENFFDSWVGLRNNVVAPWAEEWVFRSLVISLYLLAKASPTRIVFITPLIFGAAHIHHLVEFVQNHTGPSRRLPLWKVLLMGLLRSLFQLTYTSLFGFFAAFVFLRTGSVFAVITAHSFCNVMGFPRVTGRVGQVPDHGATEMMPDVTQRKRNDSLDQTRNGNSLMEGEAVRASPGGLNVAWTVAYYSLLFVGTCGFYRFLWPLTESANALVQF